MQLSEHFTLEEATESSTADRLGLNNDPTPDVLEVMYITALKMEKVRALLGNKPIKVSSWYRSPAVNKAVGSKSHASQHLVGEAVDFKCPSYGTAYQVCKQLIAYNDLLHFDQLILEHSWIHISFAILSRKPRGMVLSLLADGSYATGLTDKLGKPLTGD